MLQLNRKTGFISKDPVIYDKRGLFYQKPGEVKFNLPPGKYEYQGDLQKLSYPVKYRYPSLPFPEKFSILPPARKLNIILDEKLQRAKIRVADNLMVIGRPVLSMSTPEIASIFFHEIGHYYYVTEKYCDYYSIVCMIKLGFNPSQFVSFVNVLGDGHESIKRKEYAYKKSSEIHQVK